MAARSVWKGSINFGLVQIPVGLYRATEADEISFHLIDKRNGAPVGYERINKETGEAVPWNEIVKGYEVEDDQYVLLTDEDFAAANVEATQTVDIIHFMDAKEIEPLYYEQPYYLAPQKRAEKAYALLRETLRRSEKVGIANVVLRTRQHLAALLPRDDALVLDLLRFPHEIRAPDELELPGRDLKRLGVSTMELQMAERLVSEMTSGWDPDSYQDRYRDDLLALIQKKADEGLLNTISAEPKRRAAPKKKAEVVDLMELLKKSVAKTTGGKGAKEGHPKAAPRRPKRRTSRAPKRAAS